MDKTVLSLVNAATKARFDFAGSEVPERVAFGGSQNMAVHELLGGGRVVDALGQQPKDIEWSGWFVGANALARVRALEAMRVAGQELELTWSAFGYRVLIAAFSANFQRFYQIPYNITLTVTYDSQAEPVQTKPGIDNQMASDVSKAAELAGSSCALTVKALPLQTAAVQQNSSLLQTVMARFGSGSGSISSFANMTSSEIAAVLTPIRSLRQASQQLLAQVDNVAQSVTTLGGLAPNNPLARNATRLTNTINLFNAQPALLQLDGVLGRMTSNLQAAPAASKSITVSGGDLFTVAQQQYGDATKWTTLGQANNMADPKIVGTQELKVPPAASTSSGGVLYG